MSLGSALSCAEIRIAVERVSSSIAAAVENRFMDSPPAGIQYTPALTDSPQQLFRRAGQGHRLPQGHFYFQCQRDFQHAQTDRRIKLGLHAPIRSILG